MQTVKKVVFVLLLVAFGQLNAQEIIDQVIAVVGDEIILESEIETQVLQMKSQRYYNEADLNCDVLEELLFQKLLLKQAREDSVEVTPAEVDSELNRRLSIYINQLGSEQKLEEYYGKTVDEIKHDFRDMIKEQILTQRMQGKLTMDVDVTPSEVKKYFKSLPQDSIPYLSTSYQIKQIVIYPKVSDAERKRCKDVINGYRDRILAGSSFETLAVLYSDDPGSAPNGGELGFLARTDLVPEFAAVAFNLKAPGDVSRIVETEFGYHILQLIERKGNLVNVRHILVSPRTDMASNNKAKAELEEVRAKVLNDSLTFEKAAELYSEDENSANSGGTMLNMMTGKSWFEEAQLDPLSKDVLKQLNKGEISKIIKTRDFRGKSVFKFFKLEQKNEAHEANLKDDYQRFYEITLSEKQQKKMKEWINKTLKTTYVKIDESYQNCSFKYADWVK